jgi:hypothetical protein
VPRDSSCDPLQIGRRLLNAPENLREGDAEYTLQHAAIPRHFWIEDELSTFHVF